MTEKIRVGMIGVSHFGAHRRDTLRQSELFELAAFYARRPEAVEQVKKEEGAEACSSYDELVKRDDIEAVIISTGADTHTEFAEKAAREGKHVFVEKPLCANVEEVRALRKLEKETGIVIGLGHNHCQTDPVLKIAQDYVAEGTLGKVACFEENSSHSGALAASPDNWRFKPDRNPGGMLFQCGVHSLHALRYLFGEVKEVLSMMRYDVHVTETPDVSNVLLRYENGMVGTLNCYHVTGYYHKLRLFGTKGNIYFDTFDKTAAFQERKAGDPEKPVAVEVPPAPPEHSYAGVASFYNAIRNGGECTPSLEDGIQAVLPIFAAVRSAEQGRIVTVEEILEAG